MDIFTRDDLQELAHTDADICISIYLPTARVESEVQQNPIRLKNLLKDVRRDLKAAGVRDAKAESMLRSVTDRLTETSFWLYQSDGLAIFITEEGTRYWRLPLDFREIVYVGPRFHLKPLFPIIAASHRFYVLALSQNQVKLYQATNFGMNEVVSNEIPKSITEALVFDDFEKQLQVRTVNRVGGRHEPAFHGHGGSNDETRSRPQDRLKRFFREVDHGVTDAIGDDTAPLLLAGVDHHLPLYRDQNSYQHLVADEIVSGNPDHLSPKQLHARAWEVMERHLVDAQRKAIDQFSETRGRENGELTSTDIAEIVAASAFSRIETLFVQRGVSIWGRFDPNTGNVEVHDEQQDGDEDLLDLAAVNTYLNGGFVHSLKPERMPVNEKIAATFRFPVKEPA